MFHPFTDNIATLNARVFRSFCALVTDKTKANTNLDEAKTRSKFNLSGGPSIVLSHFVIKLSRTLSYMSHFDNCI